MIDFPVLATSTPKGYGIRELLSIVARRKLVILIPTVMMLSIACVVATTTPLRYTAEANLALDARKVQVVEIGEVVSRLPQESAALRTELDIIGARSLVEHVVARLDLASDPDILRQAGGHDTMWQRLVGFIQSQIAEVSPIIGGLAPVSQSKSEAPPSKSDVINWLLGNLKVSNDGRSFTIVVSFTSEDRDQSARIANAIAETYLDDQVKMKVAATTKANEWLGERVVTTLQRLQAAEAAVDEFRRTSGQVEAKGGNLAAQRLSELNSQLGSARLERLRAEAKFQAARERQTKVDALVSPSILELRRELADLNVRIAEARNSTGFVQRIGLRDWEQRATALQRQIDIEGLRVLASLSSEVDAARRTEAGLAETVQRLAAQSETNLRLNQLQREADANRSIYETFLTRYKQTIEQQGLATPDARLVSPADPSGATVSPKKLPILIIGGMGGLAVGIAFAFLRENLDPRVRQRWKVEEKTGIPVFGMLPRVSRLRRLEPQDYLLKAPRSPFSTALRHMHVALRLPSLPNQKRVFLFTSAQAGEGKTSFCISLARSLAASSGMRVLAIDVDSHRPRLASGFGGRTTPNFGDLAESRLRLGDVVQVDAKSSAHFIAAARDLNSILYSDRLLDLITEARLAYDVVILDTPPILAEPDAALVARFADASFLVVRWGRTSWEMMTSALGFLKLCAINVDGVVMSHVAIRDTYYSQVTAKNPALAAFPSRLHVAARE
jgi:succinoglycan biosynthesis transport protein ExoP